MLSTPYNFSTLENSMVRCVGQAMAGSWCFLELKLYFRVGFSWVPESRMLGRSHFVLLGPGRLVASVSTTRVKHFVGLNHESIDLSTPS